MPPARRALALLLGAVAVAACLPADRSVPGRPDPLPPPPDGALRVMSFNVRVDRGAGPDGWEARRDDVAETVRRYRPDLLGVQEPLRHQLDDLEERLPGYGWIGEGRRGEGDGEFAPVFYREDRLRVLDAGTFWLSPRPDRPGSRFWDAAYPRVATWGRLEDRQRGGTLVLLNTHLDHLGAFARRRSARLLLDRLEALADDGAVVLTGDLNATPGSAPVAILTGNTRLPLRDPFADDVVDRYGPAGTFTGFGDAPDHAPRIDYVLLGPGLRAVRAATVADRPGGPARAPSDHRPVVVDVVAR